MSDKPIHAAVWWGMTILVLVSLAARAEIVDRIVAVVGGRAIAWSAVDEEARYQAFRKGEQPTEWSVSAAAPDGMDTVLDALIDQRLLQQALSRSPFALAGSEDVAAQLREIEQSYPSADAFGAALRRYGLSEEQLSERLARESLLMAFVDATLRPKVRLAEEQIEAYYRDVLLPQLASTGTSQAAQAPPPLEDVRPQIEEVLTQQQINQRLLEEFLQQLRRTTPIERRTQSQPRP